MDDQNQIALESICAINNEIFYNRITLIKKSKLAKSTSNRVSHRYSLGYLDESIGHVSIWTTAVR